MGYTLNAGKASDWADQSGTGRDVAQITADNQPLYHADGGPNGHAYMEYDGVNDALQGIWTQAQPVTTFLVALPSVALAPGWLTLIDGGVFNGMHIETPAVITSLRLRCGGGSPTITKSGSNNRVWQRIDCIADGASSRLAVNNSPSTGGVNVVAVGGLTIGASGGLSSELDCLVAEVIQYDAALSTDDITLVHDYLTARYGI